MARTWQVRCWDGVTRQPFHQASNSGAWNRETAASISAVGLQGWAGLGCFSGLLILWGLKKSGGISRKKPQRGQKKGHLADVRTLYGSSPDLHPHAPHLHHFLFS